uniref:C3H1-type domain-containing protein n=1 Tax=Schistocephalus solidus TaxID=70667 RepID=A0A0X3PKC4_SCHSO
MTEFGEFEEGEVGDLSDFEDSSQAGGRSQPLTPAGNEVDINSGYEDGRKDRENCLAGKGLELCPSPTLVGGRHNINSSDTVACTKGREQGRPGSLLNLLSDDEGPNVPKPVGAVRKKKRREWSRGIKRHASNRTERPRCRFFVEGRCNKGADCPFSHDVLPSKKQELCKFYATGGCSKGRQCPFLHGEFPCKFFHLTRNCYHGDSCKFSHLPLNPKTKALLDRIANDKTPLNAVEESTKGFPTDAGVSRQCLPHGEVAEPYGDIDYRGDNTSCLKIVRGGQLPMGFEQRPPRPDMDLDFDSRPYEFGPRAPPNYNTQRPRIFPPGSCRFPNGVGRPAYRAFGVNLPGMQQEFQRARGPIPSPQTRFGFPPNFSYPRLRSPRPALGRMIEPEKSPITVSQPPPVAASSGENLSTVAQEGQQNDLVDPLMQPVPELTLKGDFVLSVSEQASDDRNARQWRLLPLEIQEKSAYTSLGLASANDPRLVSRVTSDPRLQTGRSKAAFSSAISAIPIVSKDSEREGRSPQPQSNLSSATPTENSDCQTKTGSKRRVKLQLNELANNFVAGASLAQIESKEAPITAVTTGERSYLLDPRLKRRRVVTIEQQQKHQQPDRYSAPPQTMKSPSDEISGSAMQISINGTDSGQPA